MIYRVQKFLGGNRYSVFQVSEDRFHHVPGCPWFKTEQEAKEALLDFQRSELIRVQP